MFISPEKMQPPSPTGGIRVYDNPDRPAWVHPPGRASPPRGRDPMTWSNEGASPRVLSGERKLAPPDVYNPIKVGYVPPRERGSERYDEVLARLDEVKDGIRSRIPDHKNISPINKRDRLEDALHDAVDLSAEIVEARKTALAAIKERDTERETRLAAERQVANATEALDSLRLANEELQQAVTESTEVGNSSLLATISTITAQRDAARDSALESYHGLCSVKDQSEPLQKAVATLLSLTQKLASDLHPSSDDTAQSLRAQLSEERRLRIEADARIEQQQQQQLPRTEEALRSALAEEKKSCEAFKLALEVFQSQGADAALRAALEKEQKMRQELAEEVNKMKKQLREATEKSEEATSPDIDVQTGHVAATAAKFSEESLRQAISEEQKGRVVVEEELKRVKQNAHQTEEMLRELLHKEQNRRIEDLQKSFTPSAQMEEALNQLRSMLADEQRARRVAEEKCVADSGRSYAEESLRKALIDEQRLRIDAENKLRTGSTSLGIAEESLRKALVEEQTGRLVVEEELKRFKEAIPPQEEFESLRRRLTESEMELSKFKCNISYENEENLKLEVGKLRVRVSEEQRCRAVAEEEVRRLSEIHLEERASSIPSQVRYIEKLQEALVAEKAARVCAEDDARRVREMLVNAEPGTINEEILAAALKSEQQARVAAEDAAQLAKDSLGRPLSDSEALLKSALELEQETRVAAQDEAERVKAALLLAEAQIAAVESRPLPLPISSPGSDDVLKNALELEQNARIAAKEEADLVKEQLKALQDQLADTQQIECLQTALDASQEEVERLRQTLEIGIRDGKTFGGDDFLRQTLETEQEARKVAQDELEHLRTKLSSQLDEARELAERNVAVDEIEKLRQQLESQSATDRLLKASLTNEQQARKSLQEKNEELQAEVRRLMSTNNSSDDLLRTSLQNEQRARLAAEDQLASLTESQSQEQDAMKALSEAEEEAIIRTQSETLLKTALVAEQQARLETQQELQRVMMENQQLVEEISEERGKRVLSEDHMQLKEHDLRRALVSERRTLDLCEEELSQHRSFATLNPTEEIWQKKLGGVMKARGVIEEELEEMARCLKAVERNAAKDKRAGDERIACLVEALSSREGEAEAELRSQMEMKERELSSERSKVKTFRERLKECRIDMRKQGDERKKLAQELRNLEEEYLGVKNELKRCRDNNHKIIEARRIKDKGTIRTAELEEKIIILERDLKSAKRQVRLSKEEAAAAVRERNAAFDEATLVEDAWQIAQTTFNDDTRVQELEKDLREAETAKEQAAGDILELKHALSEANEAVNMTQSHLDQSRLEMSPEPLDHYRRSVSRSTMEQSPAIVRSSTVGESPMISPPRTSGRGDCSFEDAVTGEVHSFSLSDWLPGAIQYTTNGQARPPSRRIAYDPIKGRLRFIDTGRNVDLPANTKSEVISQVRAICEKAGVPHNIAAPNALTPKRMVRVSPIPPTDKLVGVTPPNAPLTPPNL